MTARRRLLVLLVLALGVAAQMTWRRLQGAGPAVEIIDRGAGDAVPHLDMPLRSIVPGTVATYRLRDVLASRCVILYFFDPACPACEIGADKWRGVSNSWWPPGLDVVWVALGDYAAAGAFLRSRGLQMRALAAEDTLARRKLGVRSVPSAWAVVADTIRVVKVGASSTSADSLRRNLQWCPTAAA